MPNSPGFLPIAELGVAGRRFRYRCLDRHSRRMTLRKDHRIDGAPSINEHRWEISGEKIIFFHRNGQQTLEFIAQGRGRYTGWDRTQNPPANAWMVSDWRANILPIRVAFQGARRVLSGRRFAVPPQVTRTWLLENSIACRVGSKTLRWILPMPHWRSYMADVLMPWALPGCERVGPEAVADFIIGASLPDEVITSAFADLPGKKFLVSVEVETRFPKIPNCFAFVQNPAPTDDPSFVRYAPTFCSWVPPRNTEKKYKCSVVDNGQYAWRVKMIREMSRRVGGLASASAWREAARPVAPSRRGSPLTAAS